MIRICFVLLFLVVGVANSICQNNNKLQTISQIASDDSIVVSAIDALLVYPLTSDKSIEEYKKRAGVNNHFIFPLLILNDIIIREEKKVNCFRNRFDFYEYEKYKTNFKSKSREKRDSQCAERWSIICNY